MTTKRSLTRVTTPKGVAGYSYLLKPDTKFDEVGNYRVEITLSAADYSELSDVLELELQKSVEQAKQDPKLKGKKIKVADLPVTYLDDGSVKLNVKCKAKVIGKKDGKVYDLKPVLYDAKGKRIEGDPKMGAGSTIRVAFEVRPYYTALVGAGISLSLQAVQIIELVKYSGGGAASGFGFGEEDGYEAAADADDTGSGFSDETGGSDYQDDEEAEF